MKKISLISLAIFLLTSCANNEEKLQKIWSNHFQKNFDETTSIKVFVATNRKAKNENFSCDENFGVNFDAKLQLGICNVNVPKNHKVGEIELAKDVRQSSHNFFKILDGKSLSERDFIDGVKDKKRVPLVFVHGFNVRFQEAVLRAAQIAYDLKYQGSIILFTWPSGAGEGFVEEKMLNKTYDNNFSNAKASIEIFKNFLLTLQKKGIKINLTIHSMGHQLAIPALKQLGEEHPKKIFVNELFLNAPDFDVKEFSSLVQNIKPISNRITLYCSYNDKAMIASRTVNKNERLGACAFVEGVDVINVGAIDDSSLGLGHGYYSSREILTDVAQTLFGIEAEKRLFIIKSETNGTEKFLLRR